MHEAERVLDMIINARRHTTKVLPPRPEPLDFPAATVAAQSAPVLSERLDPVRLVRRDYLDAPARQLNLERVAVISLVAGRLAERVTLGALLVFALQLLLLAAAGGGGLFAGRFIGVLFRGLGCEFGLGDLGVDLAAEENGRAGEVEPEH